MRGVDQRLRTYEEQVSLHSDALRLAAKAGNYGLLAFNARSAVTAQLMVALLDWRCRGHNPSKALEKVCDLAAEALEWMEAVAAGHPHWESFDFAVPAYSASLIDRQFVEIPTALLDLTKKELKNLLPGALDACVLAAMRTGREPSVWRSYLSHVSGRGRLALVAETYATYMGIALTATASAASARQAVESAVRLYEARATDSFYRSGRAIDGGGEDNSSVVDFRLSALVKTCLPDYEWMPASISAVHRWKW